MIYFTLKNACILITDQKDVCGGDSGEIVNSVMFYRHSRQGLNNSPFKITTLWIHQTELRHPSATPCLSPYPCYPNMLLDKVWEVKGLQAESTWDPSENSSEMEAGRDRL